MCSAGNRGENTERKELRSFHLEVISYCGQSHQTPPDTVVEWPVRALRSLPLKGKDEAGEHEDRHHEHQDDQGELLVTRQVKNNMNIRTYRTTPGLVNY